MNRVLLAGSLLFLFAAPSSGQNGNVNPLPLSGDPSHELDLGATRVPLFPKRESSDGPIMRSAYDVRSLVEAGRQVLPKGGPSLLQTLLGKDLAAVRPWLSRISNQEPYIFSTGSWTLVSTLGSTKVTEVTPLEAAWVKAYCSDYEPKRNKLTPEEVAHLWARRFLALEAAVADLLALAPDGTLPRRGSGYRPLPHPRTEVYLFDSKDAHESFANHILEPKAWPLAGAVVESGPLAVVHLAGAPEDQIARRFRFGVTLQLLRSHRRAPGGLPPWLRIGIAHYMEHRLTQIKTKTKDEAGTLPPEEDAPRDWDQAVRDLAASGKAGEIGALTATSERGLTGKFRLQAWSLVRFLVGLSPKKFGELTSMLWHIGPDGHAQKALLEAVRQVYETDLPTLEKAWKAWVLRRSPGR